MNTVGKFCLVVTILLLIVATVPIPGPWGGWTPKLLVIHSEWSEQLREAKKKVQTSQERELAARQEFMKAAAELESVAFGWDRSWNVAPRNNQQPTAPFVLVGVDGNNKPILRLGLGGDQTTNTIQLREGVTVAQPPQDLQQGPLVPILQVFYTGAENAGDSGASTYLGEFRVSGGQNAKVRILIPIHEPDTEDMSRWPRPQDAVSWRIRTIIRLPGPLDLDTENPRNMIAPRSRIEELQRRKITQKNLIAETDRNITAHQKLLTEAQQALAIREGELLGDAARPAIGGRPEFTEGLLKVTEDVEEDRDQLLLDVDALRRSIKESGEARDVRLEELRKAMEALPGSSTDYDQITQPQVAVDK